MDCWLIYARRAKIRLIEQDTVVGGRTVPADVGLDREQGTQFAQCSLVCPPGATFARAGNHGHQKYQPGGV